MFTSYTPPRLIAAPVTRKALITAKGSTVVGVISGARISWIGPWSPRTHQDQATKATVEMTTHLGQGMSSTNGDGRNVYVYVYVYIYMCVYV